MDEVARVRRGRRWRTVVGAATLAAIVVAGCSDDGGVTTQSAKGGGDTTTPDTDRATTSARPTTTRSATTAPRATTTTGRATTVPATTTPAPTTAPIPRATGVAAAIPTEYTDLPSAFAVDLLAPGHGRGMLLVANAQTALGQRFAPALWESADGQSWTQSGGAEALSAGGSSNVNGSAWIGDTLAVAGSFIDQRGRHPAVWSATDGRTFAAPEDPFGALGFVAAIAAGPNGPIIAGIQYHGNLGEVVVAGRNASGKWTVVSLESDGLADVTGIAAVGDDIVVTGSVRHDAEVDVAAWVSHDGGGTFAPADTSAVPAGSSAFGQLTTWSSGFVAATCITSSAGNVGLAVSADGATWSMLPITALDGDGNAYPFRGTDCSSLTSSGDHVLLGVNDISPAVLLVDQAGSGRAIYASRTDGHISEDAPMAVSGPAGIVVVSRQTRGFAAGVESAGFTDPTATGLPVGGPGIDSTSIGPVIGGTAASVSAYPIVTEEGNGAYSWGPERTWFQSPDLTTWSPTDAFTGFSIDVVASSGSLDVGFGVGTDPQDDGDGASGGIEAFSRGDGQAWQSHGIVLGGLGGQFISDVRPLPVGFVAVGESRVRDQSTGIDSSSPVALSSVDGANWVVEQVPADNGDAFLTAVCPLPGGNVLALGGTRVNGILQMFATVRTPDSVWQTVDSSAFGGFADAPHCAANATQASIVYTRGDHPEVVTTTDGTTFRHQALTADSFANTTFDGVVAVGERFVAGGLAPLLGANRPALWLSTDGIAWSPLLVDGWLAIAEVSINNVGVAADHVVVSGIRDGAPTVFSLAFTALPG